MRDYFANARNFYWDLGLKKKLQVLFFMFHFGVLGAPTDSVNQECPLSFLSQFLFRITALFFAFILKTSIFLISPFFNYSNRSPFDTAWSCTTRNAILVYRRPVFQHSWVRPHYAESTTSRLICEVKQRQA